MNTNKLQSVVVNALEEVKAQNIAAFDSTAITDLFDRVVIASGTSNRQTRALAMSVVEEVKKAGGSIISVEGEETGEWVLVDCGDVICHIMQPPIRSYYNLEELWGQDPVELHPVDDSTEQKSPVKKSSPKRHAVEKAVTKKPATKTAATKSSGAKSTAVKKSVAKAPAAKKLAAKKPAAKKPAAKTAATKKVAAKKPALKAAPAKRKAG